MKECVSWGCLVGVVAGVGSFGGSTAATAQSSESEEIVDVGEVDAVVVEPPGELGQPPVVALEAGDPELLASPPDRLRLGAWLEYTSAQGKKGRRSTGISMLIAGSLIMGIGLGVALSSASIEDYEIGFGLGLVGIGGLYLSVGIVQLAKTSDSERRFNRWQQISGGRLSLRELARFEGELRSQSERAERSVRVGRWTNFGLAMTGALVLGLVPASNLSGDAATFGYVFGGVALGVGLIGFAFSFIKSPETSHWQAYQQGQNPPGPRVRKWSASPAFGRHFAGARVTRHF